MMRATVFFLCLGTAGCVTQLEKRQQAQIDGLTRDVQILDENQAALEEEVMAIYTMLGASRKPPVEHTHFCEPEL